MKYITIFLIFMILIYTLSIEKINVPFIYQLQNIDLQKIYTFYTPKFLVIDVFYLNNKDKVYLKKLQKDGTKILAYLSIGEAESYRDYWKDAWKKNPPKWLGKENKYWKGNYKVKYWYSEWKNIVFKTIDKILSYNIDGLYLDLIDSYKYWSENGYEIMFTANEMIRFVREIKEKVNNLLIVPQNGEDIIDFDFNNLYIRSIDGIGIETLFFYKNRKLKSEKRLMYILKIQNSEKFVLVTDYIYPPNDENILKEFINLCEKYHFYGYPANKNQRLKDISLGLKYYKKYEGN
ncbi:MULTISPECIES: MJ1477/TM1410 family putative glycoside hydrolase [unclassified Thermosipho (in: thermotogales)]|uniref:MJ1477/TM1410 family putative glycoside hydrolase n=1 Tax=unclassified Thermosipho (in: thermotogales) TaxID=2676525 RepID=UPI000985C725|nr:MULTISPECIES: MJ1477/TM1410 family putative glycoside hydrolase [unclassified Thermosipho (in: thermotogales)]MBT1248055.1 hypothetical protein [Thermosipho sp. 1244]OOC46649.1 cysteinyl-tRNA synthetase [Thermosipho sp. 1223]